MMRLPAGCLIVTAVLAAAAMVSAAAPDPEATAIEAALDDQLADRPTAWLLVAADGRRWQRGFSDTPILPGSLLKPFAALAWIEAHAEPPPVVSCDGSNCWLPSGHGALGLSAALANSCNHYFRRLVRAVEPDQIAGVALRYGLSRPPSARPDSWWGWGDEWRVPAANLLQAYQELERRQRQPAPALVVSGLRQAATAGTAAAIARALPAEALAKTGTAPCRHASRSSGDGLAVILYPASNPRYTMLLQACGFTGRETAATAGLALARMTAQRVTGRP